MCQYIGPCVSYVYMCVISNQTTSKKHVIRLKPLVNVMHETQQGAAGTKVPGLVKVSFTTFLSKATQKINQ